MIASPTLHKTVYLTHFHPFIETFFESVSNAYTFMSLCIVNEPSSVLLCATSSSLVAFLTDLPCISAMHGRTSLCFTEVLPLPRPCSSSMYERKSSKHLHHSMTPLNHHHHQSSIPYKGYAYSVSSCRLHNQP